MTPDRRLDQVEPLVADGLQKIDRLIEGQGQLLEVATRSEQKADTTAKGVANLTLSTQAGFTKTDGKIEQLQDQLSELRSEMNQKFDLIINLLRQK